MNQLLSLLLSALKNDKGRDVNRTLVLIGVIYCCAMVTNLDKRVAVIEATARAHASTNPPPATTTNTFAHVLP